MDPGAIPTSQTTRSKCALTIDPHVGGRYDGKDKQEHDEDKRL